MRHKASIWAERCASVSKPCQVETAYAVDVPVVTMPPATSSRYLAAAAIMARALSFTDEGDCPSAQLMVLSAVALLAGVCDHFQKVMRVPQKETAPCGAAFVSSWAHALASARRED
jgi:hypothetical protein